MGTLADLLPMNNGAALQYRTNLVNTNATTDAGVAIDRGTEQYNQQTLPNLVNASAASGDAYGGQLNHDVSMAHNAFMEQYGPNGDIERKLAQSKSETIANALLASRGISV